MLDNLQFHYTELRKQLYKAQKFTFLHFFVSIIGFNNTISFKLYEIYEK